MKPLRPFTLYNTASRTLERFEPQAAPRATVYTCGPTVYDYPHIGNWFTFVRYDLLIRALRLAGYQPDWVMNITDVGHLVGDTDEGEDKLEKGARREGRTAWDVAVMYGENFVHGLQRLNFLTPDQLPKATDHIKEQIELVQQLQNKGCTYTIDDGVYFDTAKFPAYAGFARLDLAEQQAGKRVELNRQKRNPTDFALWKFSLAGQQRDMEWDSPFTGPDGQAHKGFPGWHLECSAMGMKYLGHTIDLHAGGIDHIPVHHTNEIAQSEAATGQPFVRYWLHTNHISVNGEKISKSLGNGITLEDIVAKGYEPAVLRLHILESHYRSQSKFSWESLEAARNRLQGLRAAAALRWQLRPAVPSDGAPATTHAYPADVDIITPLLNDLDTPLLLANLNERLGTASAPRTEAERQALEQYLDIADQALGLDLLRVKDISQAGQQLLAGREAARQAKDWPRADELRDELQAQGIGVRDASDGVLWYWL